MQAVSLRFSPALWRRGRGANLKPRLSQAASLATERPPRNMAPIAPSFFTTGVNIQATEVTETLPQALKRDLGTDGSYARLKGVLHPSLYTRCETAIRDSPPRSLLPAISLIRAKRRGVYPYPRIPPPTSCNPLKRGGLT